MPLRRTLGLCFLFAMLACGGLAGEQKEPEPAEPDRVIPLFDGRGLSAFYTWLKDSKYDDPRKVFTVLPDVDGAPAIRISGDGFGGITTKYPFRNYRLVVEYRWGEKTWDSRKKATRDSGILLHCFGPDGSYNGTWPASVECQIIEGGVGDFIVVPGKGEDGKDYIPSITCEVAQDRDGEYVWKKGGERKSFSAGRVNWYGRDPDWEDTLGFRGKQDVDSPGREWTRVEVICDGDTITNIVNGVTVNQAFDVQPRAGKITIQTELAEIFIRRIELHPLRK